MGKARRHFLPSPFWILSQVTLETFGYPIPLLRNSVQKGRRKSAFFESCSKLSAFFIEQVVFCQIPYVWSLFDPYAGTCIQKMTKSNEKRWWARLVSTGHYGRIGTLVPILLLLFRHIWWNKLSKYVVILTSFKGSSIAHKIGVSNLQPIIGILHIYVKVQLDVLWP